MAQNVPQPVHGTQRVLIDLQRHLMSSGYTYVSGNPYEWPLPYVVMTKAQDVLVLAGASQAVSSGALRVWENLDKAKVPRALLLVGEQEDLESLKAMDLSGTVARICASSGELAVRRQGPSAKVAGKRQLRRLLDVEPPEGMTAGTCQAALQRNLEELQASQAFHERAQRASHRPSPLLTYALIGACIMLFAAMFIIEGASVLSFPSREVLHDWGGLYGPSVRQGQWWRVISSAFLHIGALHLAFNMYALGIFGSLLERLQGRGRMAAIYAVSLLTAAIGSLWWHPQVLSAGASGGIFGLIGGVAALLVRHHKDFPPHMRKAIRRWLLTILGYNVVLMGVMYEVIDNAAHIGGFAGGLLVGLILTRSPVRRESIRPWQVAAGACLLVLVALGGAHAWQGIAQTQDKPWETARRDQYILDRCDLHVGRIEAIMQQAPEAVSSVPEIQYLLEQVANARVQLPGPEVSEISNPDLRRLVREAHLVARAAQESLQARLNAIIYDHAPGAERTSVLRRFNPALQRYRRARAQVPKARDP
jgi:membrane associated rhomboid family serine protease